MYRISKLSNFVPFYSQKLFNILHCLHRYCLHVEWSHFPIYHSKNPTHISKCRSKSLLFPGLFFVLVSDILKLFSFHLSYCILMLHLIKYGCLHILSPLLDFKLFEVCSHSSWDLWCFLSHNDCSQDICLYELMSLSMRLGSQIGKDYVRAV